MRYLRQLALPAALIAVLALVGCSQHECHGEDDSVVLIDGAAVPLTALYPSDAETLTIRPIGYVVNDRYRGPDSFGITGGDISEIRLYPGMARFMKGLEDETSLLILWHFHQARPIPETTASSRWR